MNCWSVLIVKLIYVSWQHEADTEQFLTATLPTLAHTTVLEEITITKINFCNLESKTISRWEKSFSKVNKINKIIIIIKKPNKPNTFVNFPFFVGKYRYSSSNVMIYIFLSFSFSSYFFCFLNKMLSAANQCQ